MKLLSAGTPVTGQERGAGLLVLGMHRSGTSALARLLGIGGADLGVRVAGASEGNETGHWEDSFAVETHDTILQAFGATWADPFALPGDWRRSEAGMAAGVAIQGYVVNERSSHELWAVKDPRLCLFGELWVDAVRAASARASAVLVLRSPSEIAASLRVRDGIGSRHAAMLWLDYMQGAMRVLSGLPHLVITFDQLLSDWRSVADRMQSLPAGQALLYGPQEQAIVDVFLDPGRRHHRAATPGEVPPLAEVWHALSSCAQEGRLTREAIEMTDSITRQVREMVAPLLEETRAEVRHLWSRAARAEERLAEGVTNSQDVTTHFAELHRRVEEQHSSVIQVYSDDIRLMQEAHARALAEAEAARGALGEARAEMLAPLGQRLDAVEQRLVQVYSDDIRRMQDMVVKAQADASALAGELEESRRGAELAVDTANALRAELSAAMGTVATALAALSSANQRSELLQSRLESAQEAQAMLESRTAVQEDAMDRQMREIAAHVAELESLRPKAKLLSEVLRSHSWQLTRPLRVFRRLLGGHWSSADRHALLARTRQLAQRLPLLPQSLRERVISANLPQEAVNVDVLPDDSASHLLTLAPPDGRVADVFVWSVIDWHFRTQRPQHLARALAAKGHRVFYVSNNFADATEPGFRVDPLDEDGRLFQVHLNLGGAPAIYYAMPTEQQAEALRASLAALLEWTCTRAAISLVQHPYWTPLVRAVPSARMVYDCMDHHAGFADNATAIVEAERRLVQDADLVVVTSEWLLTEVSPDARATALVRNAGEHAFFAQPPAKAFKDSGGRRIIGYYGAIAEWFDPELVRAVALAHPGALVVLVGNDTAGVGAKLADLPNLRMVGEVPYADLPYWLHGFDVCLLPFKVIPLTLATNPVKVYEYLAAGKPVVVVDLPEMTQFGEFVHVAADPESFARAVGDALAEDGPDDVAGRQAFAEGQTWGHRAAAFDEALARLSEPTISVVVLTYNNLAYTDACLFSIEAYSDYPNLEVIVVDNASTDGSREWLQAWAAEASPAGHVRRLLLNDSNLGFAAGNNVGLRAATGDVLVLLNNDTYVTPGWVRGLSNHLRVDRSIGLIGPVTNNIGNEARIPIAYSDMAEMIEQAGKYTRCRPGAAFPLHNAAFFCVAMPRDVYRIVGDLDEAFGLGFFEDDDYCRRVEQAGFTIACAEDVFVHHHLSASFDALKAERKQELFEANKAIYQRKWGAWRPHVYR